MQSLTIDNVGFDVKAMAAMPEKEFVDTHMENDAIGRGRQDPERKQWLKDAYAEIKKVASAPVANIEEKPAKEKDKGVAPST